MTPDPVHQTGLKIASFLLKHGSELKPWVWVALLLALALTTLILLRHTSWGRGLAYSRPSLFRGLHYPFIAPLLTVLIGFLIAFCTPYYVDGMERYRPTSWPSLQNISIGTSLNWVALGGAMVILGALLLVLRSNHVSLPKTQRSSARWAKWGDISPVPGWRWTIPISVHFRGSFEAWRTGGGQTLFTVRESDVARHILLVGQTGSGKGFTVFGPIIESSRTPIVYQDVKGQCPGINRVKARLGVNPIRWGCAAQGGWTSMNWNAMEECRRDTAPSASFNALAAALIPGRGDEDWVAQLSRPILSWVMERGQSNSLANLQDALVNKGVDSVLDTAEVPQGLVLALQGKNVREYIGTTLFASLACFGSGWGREVTSSHDFTLADVCSQGAYVLSAEPERNLRAPLTVFWRLLLRRLQRSSEKIPLTLLFDEALAAGRIPDVQDLLMTIRDRDVSVIFGTQHLSGLRQVYGREEGDSLISSFASRIWLLSALDHRDRKELIEELGMRIIIEKHGSGSNRQEVPVEVPLLARADLNRRANQSGVFWAVIESPSSEGNPIICRMQGGPTDLIQRPPVGAIEDHPDLYSPRPTTPPLITQGEPPIQVIQALEALHDDEHELDPWD